MNLVREAIDILTERGVKFADRFIPFFVASLGCHYFNLMNRERAVFYSLGRIPDIRMQLLFTASPGWSKSLFLKQLLSLDYGLASTGDVPTRFMGSCTEAAWVGSSDGTGANSQPSIGIAEKFKNGIIGMEEFAALSEIMHQEHSKHMEQALALSLFDGDVVKSIKNRDIDYHTDVTLWAGNQTLKFDLSGGLFRRFFHIFWVPRMSEAEILRNAIWEGDNIRIDYPRITAYRLEVRRMIQGLNSVKRVQFNDNVRELLKDIPHFEQIIYRNFALGYSVMRDSNVPETIVVDADKDLTEYMKSAIVWRKQLLADPAGYQMLCLINDLGGRNFVSWDLIREKCLLFSSDNETTDAIITRLIRSKRLEHNAKDRLVKLA